MVKICGKCGKEITGNEYKMVSGDRPYYNFFFHKDCYLEIENIREYLPQNFEKLYNIYAKQEKRRKNGRE